MTAQAPAADLRDRIAQGARERDLVRLHGAIVGALELYPMDEAAATVFAPAIGLLKDPVALNLAVGAIHQQLDLYRRIGSRPGAATHA